MTLTKPSDFKTFEQIIPKSRREHVWFFPIRGSRKTPDCPIGTVLKNNADMRITRTEVEKRLQWGQNYGIYALPGGLMFLDLDTDEHGCIKASKEFREQIPKTFTVITRSGGLHYYFLNDGLYPNQVIYEDKTAIGELRTDWYYIVGVGSYVDPGQYHIFHEDIITNFSHIEGIRKHGEEEKKSPGSYKEKGKSINKSEYKQYTHGKRRIKL